MHASSYENMQRCYDLYLAERIANAALGELSVLDIGGADVNGSYRPIFSAPAVRYLTADLAAGDGVDIVLEDPYRIPLPDRAVDVVVSGQMLEHCEFFWLAFQEMLRVTTADGFIFLVAPSAGPIHRYPVDCYRFYPDAYAALAKFAGCHLQTVWRDERGPWQDLVGVFRHEPLATEQVNAGFSRLPPSRIPVSPPPTAGSAEEEAVGGTADYLDLLRTVHKQLQPELYLEIGVRHGRSLALASCPAVGVDPFPDVTAELDATAQVLETTSDDFFREHAGDVLGEAPDLVFIDGMHLFEYALRDFMQVERLSSPTTLVVVDDIYPNHPRQAARDRSTRVWCGD
ncbi:MAG: methyltransferase domain-containing protein, partial [Planctomycetes bacterium]|nr:methyltransferase domain-containing protein [Planctomycetota bacterium]